MNSLANDTGSFSEQIEQKNRELTRISLDISNSRVALAKAQTTGDEAKARMDEIDNTLSELEKIIAESEIELKKLSVDILDVDEKITQAKNVSDGNELMLTTRKEKADI